MLVVFNNNIMKKKHFSSNSQAW